MVRSDVKKLEAAMKAEGVGVIEAATPEEVLAAKPRGRPKVAGEKPWEALGVSRSAYFARKKAGQL